MSSRPLSTTFDRFLASEQSAGVLLVVCTILSLAVTNSAFGSAYGGVWQVELAGLSLQHWINDALMAVFFLLIGLELKRELYVGELADMGRAFLPVVAAAGGVAMPALIHLALNAGTATEPGAGIPIATDIAFALAVLALVGSRAPPSLKVFLAALAVMGFCRLPSDLGWRHIVGVGLLGGIGFTMSIFITNLAFAGEIDIINSSKIAVLLSSVASGVIGVLWLRLMRREERQEGQ